MDQSGLKKPCPKDSINIQPSCLVTEGAALLSSESAQFGSYLYSDDKAYQN